MGSNARKFLLCNANKVTCEAFLFLGGERFFLEAPYVLLQRNFKRFWRFLKPLFKRYFGVYFAVFLLIFDLHSI